MKTYTIYRVTTAKSCYDEYTDRHIAEKELNNLLNNGKQATLTEIKREY